MIAMILISFSKTLPMFILAVCSGAWGVLSYSRNDGYAFDFAGFFGCPAVGTYRAGCRI